MNLFRDDATKLEEAIPHIFTPATPITAQADLKGRDDMIEDLKRSYRRQGSSIVLYGERGVGKTSVAKVAQAVLPGNHLYYSCSTKDTFETIASSILSQHKTLFQTTTQQKSQTTTKEAGIKIPVASGGLGHERQTSFIEQPIGQVRLTPQEIANRLPCEEGLIVIDDFERIQDTESRVQFADLIKKLSDNRVPITFMIVGIGENLQVLLSSHESAQRSIAEIRAPRLSHDDLKKVVSDGFAKLGVEIEADNVEQIAEFSARFPYYTHLLCEGAAMALVSKLRTREVTDLRVGSDEVTTAINHAIRNTEYSISHAYEEATRSISDSPRFKYTLYAIASWPEEPVPYREICKWVGKIIKAPDEHVNVSHQLKSLEGAGIIGNTTRGMYKFLNPILKAFVVLKVRSDTPAVELAAIDAQIKHTQKRLDRISQRF